jgi:5-aminopentanamidase
LLTGNSKEEQVEANWSTLDDAMKRASADHKTELFVTCECFLQGYSIGALRFRKLAIEQNNALARLSSLCKRHNMASILGYAELVVSLDDDRDSEVVANSIMLVGADGSLLANYRKLHLWSDYERGCFEAGARLPPICNVNDVRVALAICYDIEFGELARHCAANGADLIAVPTASVTPFNSESLVPTRAYENGIHVAYVNRGGEERGACFDQCRTALATPSGTRIAADAGNGAMLHAIVVPDSDEFKQARLRNPWFDDLRSDLLTTFN